MVSSTINRLNISTNTHNNKAEMDRLINDISDDLITQIQWGLEDSGGTPFGKINFTEDTSDSVHTEEEQGFTYIVVDSPYAGFIEYGMPSSGSVGNGSMVNIDQLRSWVFHKLGIKDEEENMSVTFAIAQKIAKDGIKPRRFMKKAIIRFVGGRSVPNKPRAKRAKSGFFAKLKKKFKKLKILKKLKKTSKKIKKVINKADRTYKKVRRYR